MSLSSIFWPVLAIEGESAWMTLKGRREEMTNSEKEDVEEPWLSRKIIKPKKNRTVTGRVTKAKTFPLKVEPYYLAGPSLSMCSPQTITCLTLIP